MAGDSNLHSRVVGWLKVVLPLLALAILSTLFFISDRIDPNAAIPASGLDIEARVRQPRMTEPAYSGMTDDGAALTLRAAEARPQTGKDQAAGSGAGSGTASRMTGQLRLPDGSTADLRADLAEIDTTARVIHLRGNVGLRSSTGYDVTSSAMTAALDRTRLESPGPVRAAAPIGTIAAGGMVLTADPARKDSYVLVFNSRVKLIYRPGL